MIDERVMQIADDALCGAAPSRADVVYLLGFDAYSVEASYVCARARELGMRACGGRGYLYAQIGVDQNPCPEDCRFCSFAVSNMAPVEGRGEGAGGGAGGGAGEGGPASSLEVPIGRIVHYAKLFDAEGVDLLSLMATAGLAFDRYLDMVRAVRASVSPGLVLMANCGDLSLEQARALKDAGVDAAYHALRLGEGDLTGIRPIDRRRTIRHLHAAGLQLMTGVEPVWEGVGALALSERICDVPEFEPFAMGACRYTPIGRPGMEGRQPASTGMLRYVAAITRLACGDSVPVGGIGGVAWVDAGTDPRNRGYGSDDSVLRKGIAQARKRLSWDGFDVG